MFNWRYEIVKDKILLQTKVHHKTSKNKKRNHRKVQNNAISYCLLST
uniref:Uncharacterized protein n=1 Tax=virus sp. ctpeS3 TaxID=2826815 RepID=A0A8S5R9F5_9VIRU|nr:MAG TPA: hypothetical protein [virus sp. ctpeS3]